MLTERIVQFTSTEGGGIRLVACNKVAAKPTENAPKTKPYTKWL